MWSNDFLGLIMNVTLPFVWIYLKSIYFIMSLSYSN